MNQIEGHIFYFHFTCKKLRFRVKQRGSPLLWTKDWPQGFCYGPQPGDGPFFSHKTNSPEFGLIAARRHEMKGLFHLDELWYRWEGYSVFYFSFYF